MDDAFPFYATQTRGVKTDNDIRLVVGQAENQYVYLTQACKQTMKEDRHCFEKEYGCSSFSDFRYYLSTKQCRELSLHSSSVYFSLAISADLLDQFEAESPAGICGRRVLIHSATPDNCIAEIAMVRVKRQFIVRRATESQNEVRGFLCDVYHYFDNHG